jgi:hypothetical protein
MPGTSDEFALRLRRILEELGYCRGKRVLVEEVARAIRMRTAGDFGVRDLRKLLYGERAWLAADVRRVADGLQIDPRELLYDTRDMPANRPAISRRKRPKGASIWAELDGLPTPER